MSGAGFGRDDAAAAFFLSTHVPRVWYPRNSYTMNRVLPAKLAWTAGKTQVFAPRQTKPHLLSAQSEAHAGAAPEPSSFSLAPPPSGSELSELDLDLT